MRFTGILLGTFRDFDNVVMERSCVERTSWALALSDAQHLRSITEAAESESWIAAVETEGGEVIMPTVMVL